MKLKWRRRAIGGWITEDGKWTVRGPIMSKPMFWLYFGTNRYTPTGRYSDSVNFTTSKKAKEYAEQIANYENNTTTHKEDTTHP